MKSIGIILLFLIFFCAVSYSQPTGLERCVYFRILNKNKEIRFSNSPVNCIENDKTEKFSLWLYWNRDQVRGLVKDSSNDLNSKMRDGLKNDLRKDSCIYENKIVEGYIEVDCGLFFGDFDIYIKHKKDTMVIEVKNLHPAYYNLDIEFVEGYYRIDFKKEYEKLPESNPYWTNITPRNWNDILIKMPKK